jgi:hypothetical protein
MISTKKYVVYTAICGDEAHSDDLHDPKEVFPDTDYIAFVDRKHKTSDVWRQVRSTPFSIDTKYFNRRNAKIYKAMPHLFMDGWHMSIWHDPTHEVVVNPEEIYKNIITPEKDIALFRHESRDCVYSEAAAVLNWKMDHEKVISDQMDFYRANNYPEKNGLYECPVIIRNSTLKTETLGMRWWEIISKYSSRDQLSMPFVLWSLNIDPVILEGTAGKEYKRNNKIVPFKRNHNWEPNIKHLNLD